MFKAITHNIWGALNDISGGLGVIMSAVATILNLQASYGQLSQWFWALAALLFFIRSVKLYQELVIAKDTSRKPTPTITLNDVLIRIRGKTKISGIDNSESMQLMAALTLIREKAQNDEVTAFGRKDWRSTRPADMEALAPRTPIPQDYWAKHSIDYMALTDDRRGVTYDKSNMTDTNTYLDIWFDHKQIDKLWPPPKQKLREWIKSKL